MKRTVISVDSPDLDLVDVREAGRNRARKQMGSRLTLVAGIVVIVITATASLISNRPDIGFASTEQSSPPSISTPTNEAPVEINRSIVDLHGSPFGDDLTFGIPGGLDLSGDAYASSPPTILNFWQPNCEACNRDLEVLEEFAQSHGWIAITIVSPEASNEAFDGLRRISKGNIGISVNESGSLAERFGVSIFPTSFIYWEGGSIAEEDGFIELTPSMLLDMSKGPVINSEFVNSPWGAFVDLSPERQAQLILQDVIPASVVSTEILGAFPSLSDGAPGGPISLRSAFLKSTIDVDGQKLLCEGLVRGPTRCGRVLTEVADFGGMVWFSGSDDVESVFFDYSPFAGIHPELVNGVAIVNFQTPESSPLAPPIRLRGVLVTHNDGTQRWVPPAMPKETTTLCALSYSPEISEGVPVWLPANLSLDGGPIWFGTPYDNYDNDPTTLSLPFGALTLNFELTSNALTLRVERNNTANGGVEILIPTDPTTFYEEINATEFANDADPHVTFGLECAPYGSPDPTPNWNLPGQG